MNKNQLAGQCLGATPLKRRLTNCHIRTPRTPLGYITSTNTQKIATATSTPRKTSQSIQCKILPPERLMPMACVVAGAAIIPSSDLTAMHKPKILIIGDQQCRGLSIIEKYTENVRFCIICNYLGKIIPALQSRCTRFRFAPLQQSQIVPRLKEVAEAEGVTLSEDGVKALLALSGGDMRRVLNTLQSTWLAYRDVTEDNVYTCVGHPLRSDINSIINWLLNENDFAVCFKNIQDLKIKKGLALGDILTEVHTILQRLKLPPAVLISLLIKLGDAEARLSTGCSERIELAALIAAFQDAREQVKVE